MLKKLYLYGAVFALSAIGFAYYRNNLIQTGYDKAVTEYRIAEAALLRNHSEEVAALVAKSKELQDANTEKSEQVDLYRGKFAAVSQRLREQQADFGRRVEAASSDSLRQYAGAVTQNFAEARSHVERLGLEAASCSVAAETLKEALDLASSR